MKILTLATILLMSLNTSAAGKSHIWPEKLSEWPPRILETLKAKLPKDADVNQYRLTSIEENQAQSTAQLIYQNWDYVVCADTTITQAVSSLKIDIKDSEFTRVVHTQNDVCGQ